MKTGLKGTVAVNIFASFLAVISANTVLKAGLAITIITQETFNLNTLADVILI